MKILKNKKMNKIIISIKWKFIVLRDRIFEKPWKKRKPIIKMTPEMWKALFNSPHLETAGMMISRVSISVPPSEEMKKSFEELKQAAERLELELKKWEAQEEKRRRRKFMALRLAALQPSWVLRKMTLAMCVMM